MQQENLVGSTLGQYQILDELGRGGMAVVYKAWQPSLRRYVALKVLLPYLGGDPEFIQRFQQEAIVAANLNHPHIVTIYEVGQQDGRIFIAMEYVEGRSLEQLILDQGGVPLDRAVRILRQVAEALDYAHKRRFLHRDIKPANILLAEDDRVVITDFGIAKAMEGSGATARLTSAGTVLGTPAYMSPEQIQGLAIDYRSDLYALGIVAYEMLSGQVPFDGTTTALLYAQVNNPPPAITRFAPGLPSHVEWVVARMLAKQPDERFVSAGEFVEALAGANGTAAQAPAYGGPAAPPLPTPTPRGGTAVMPPGVQLPQATPGFPPQPYGMPSAAQSATVAAPQPYGTLPAGPPPAYGYPATPAAAPAPAYGYAPQASGWVEPVQAKKKRAVWPWLVGGGLVLGILAVVAVVGYLFLGRMAVTRLIEEGETALAAKDYAAAQAAFEAALEKDAENAAAYRGLGWAHYYTKDYELAAADFSKAVVLDPVNAEGYRGKGMSYQALERFEEALEQLKEWSELEPQNAEAYLLQGWALLGLGQNAEAIDSFARSLELQETVNAYSGLNESYSRLRRYEEALEVCEKWLEIGPEDVNAYLSQGWVLYNLKRYDEAISVFSRSSELQETPQAYNGLGTCYYDMGNYELALNYFRQWAALAPNDATAYSHMGWSQYYLRRYQDALESFSKSAELKESISAYSGLSNSYSALNENEMALDYALRWTEIAPANSDAFSTAGWVYVRMQNCSQAKVYFEKALQLNPQHKGASDGLKQCP